MNIISKYFNIIAIAGYVFLISIIIFFQYQKNNLRDDVTTLISQRETIKQHYENEVEKITEKHNKVIEEYKNSKELDNIKKENERLKEQLKFNTEKNKELSDKLKDLNKVNDSCLNSEIPEEIKRIL